MKELKKVVRKLPYSLQTTLGQVYDFVLGCLDLIPGIRDELTPPYRMMKVGGRDFRAAGEKFLVYFKQFGNLKPSESVLDVGCGVGRMAIPLTRFLNEHGSYEGFDIVKRRIDWCNRHISLKYPNFRFQFADIFNDRYNPNGRWEASQYKFPYGSESFHFVFLTSVFTHMLPKAIENYFSEISRVLRKDGRCLITFFLLNDESLNLIQQGQSTLDFRYDFGRYRSIDKKVPESAVAFDEQYIRSLYQQHNMMLIDSPHYGSWCGRQHPLNNQDIIVASKSPKRQVH